MVCRSRLAADASKLLGTAQEKKCHSGAVAAVAAEPKKAGSAV